MAHSTMCSFPKVFFGMLPNQLKQTTFGASGRSRAMQRTDDTAQWQETIGGRLFPGDSREELL